MHKVKYMYLFTENCDIQTHSLNSGNRWYNSDKTTWLTDK